MQAIPERFQNEIIGLQSHVEAIQDFDHVDFLEFYKKFVKRDTLHNMWKLGIQLASLFGSSYVCEQMLSEINTVKGKNTSKLLHENLDSQIRHCSTNIKIDCEEIARNHKRH